jgi:hypothetical protein
MNFGIFNAYNMTGKALNEWLDVKKHLESMLNSHDVPEVEKCSILNVFDRGCSTYNVRRMVGCIDYGVQWYRGEYSYDFYYFLQLRFAYCVWLISRDNELIPKNQKEYIVRYIKDLEGYSDTPKHEDRKHEDKLKGGRLSKDEFSRMKNCYIRKNLL